MCGIIGLFDVSGKPVSSVILKAMADKLVHRGPDGDGYFTDQMVGLAHRRLAIIDLTPSGYQPMSSSDGRYILVYNGEIYNYQQLRIELESYGHQFRSKSDAEVLLYAFVQWRLKCLTHLNGMFAFAVWDKEQQQLFLARDRYGIKPLYYCFQNGVFMFASEQKAFLAHPEFRRELDLEVLPEYFTFQNIFTERTFFKNVSLFPAGHHTSVKLNQSSKLNLIKYWDFHFRQPEINKTEAAYLEELDHLFQQAVNRQLVSDVAVGSYLSGGIDSGAIAALAAQQYPYIKTFTCGFDLSSASGLELAFDERGKAEFLSNLFKTEHYEMVLKAGDMERILDKLVYHIDELRVGQSYPNFYVSQLASKFVKVVLSGVGGDELFAGYPWRYYRAVVSQDFHNYIDTYYDSWQRLISSQDADQFFSPITQSIKHIETRQVFRNVFPTKSPANASAEDYVNQSLYFEAKTFLHGLLIIEDKISMASGLETRLPFLDNDLVDFAMTLPIKYKLRKLKETVYINENEHGPKTQNYYQKTHDGKLILRKMLEKYVPIEISQAAKQGFSAPDASWFKGESIEYVKRVILNKKSSMYDYIDYTTSSNIVMQHLEGKSNHRLFIWSLLNFDVWLKLHIH